MRSRFQKERGRREKEPEGSRIEKRKQWELHAVDKQITLTQKRAVISGKQHR